MRIPWWIMNGSQSCLSTENTGLSDVIGSWKMTEIALPRMWYISDSGRVVSSFPSKRMLPLAI